VRENALMKFDVVIVGGGLAGMALAVALGRSPLSIALIEGRAPVKPDGWDARIYAISPANVCFLDEIGTWKHLDASRIQPVERMDVRGDADGRLDFSAYASGVGELASIVESSLMQIELWESAKRQANLELIYPARPAVLKIDADGVQLSLDDGRMISSRLVVAADGADSWTRAAAGIIPSVRPYGQLGVVANFETERSHQGTAFQWFRRDGVLAWLPLPGQRMSMVWSTVEAHGRELLACSPEELEARVAAAGECRLGKLKLITPAAGFPLRLMRAPCVVQPRLALIGDAAHAIHPLSGHGINLGFQDAAVLAQTLANKPAHIDCGDFALLRRYERARKEEVLALQTTTDALQRLFSQYDDPLSALPVLRNAGLNLTNRLPLVKDLLIRYALAS
jgi:ubiquinone biosynthesis UbiH/UbiF/VisC/COQ6 family hydroxylase